jgi:hypothetical protein
MASLIAKIRKWFRNEKKKP